MADNGTVIKGRDLFLKVDGVPVGCADTIDFSSSFELIEAVCRESGGFYDAEGGDFAGTMSGDGVMKYDTPTDATKMRSYDLALLHMNQTRVDFVFGADITGTQEWYGQILINEFSQSAAQKENGTYSMSAVTVGPYGLRPATTPTP